MAGPEFVVVGLAHPTVWHILGLTRAKRTKGFEGIRRYPSLCTPSRGGQRLGFITAYGALRSMRTGRIADGCPACYRAWQRRQEGSA